MDSSILQYVPLLFFVIMGVGIVLIFRGRKPTTPAGVPINEPYGIRGWLILPAISLVVAPLALVVYLVQTTRYLGDPQVADFQYVFIIESVMNAFLVAATVYVGTRFFRRRRDAPGLFVALLSVNLLIGAADSVLLSNALALSLFDESVGGSYLISGAISLAIWTAYMRRSRRVKNTFVVL